VGPCILLKTHRTELVEKNSRFIGIGCHSQSLIEFKQHKDALEKEFPDANHIVFAYRIYDHDSLHIRFSDAGEPSGTAGKPVLMHMEGNSLVNVTLFVVRYFGGTKLGAGGLVKAYGNTARQLITEASWGPYIVYKELWLALPYSETNRLEYLARKFGVEILERDFSESVRVRIRIADDNAAEFKAAVPSSWTVQA